MSRIFLDTNFLAYMHDKSEPVKQSKALALMETLALSAHTIVLSPQVLQELYNTLTRKMGLTKAAAQKELIVLANVETVTATRELVLAAIQLTMSASISIWDAMIVATAQSSKCDEVWTEDMQDGQRFDDVEIVNPFVRR